MAQLDQLVAYCNDRTRLHAYTDAPGAKNGLQVANNGTVTKIGAAVDAGLVPFRAAVAAGVDFLIVHHGMYWDMPQLLTGPVYDRVATLITGNCALYSNHLPLDGHQEIGNNVLLAKQLGLTPDQPFMMIDGEPVGVSAPWSGTRADLHAALATHYERVVPITCGSDSPRRIAFCSGSGNSAMKELIKTGIDTMVTGELREEWFNVAQERGINVFLCGHYATEVHAVQALATELAAKFDLPWEFIRTDNPL
ncbi:Nif3-like dinuclear metal center hexameric protein [Synoicihabitans lomoniglobus]|uniref:Nif3-like dinuclear metal center hexameric protein n=1 Tax=Synoicihabitans lomoniglobus TaxID=2909285 RepID=A0AAF0CR10_9BACT|nr:Nif3-like dinuclear metal center hexameric protein [Opitutaceae bacterium LMO-M01]WED66461.1 Nif3-like dinuclear metal center hexameric protein [Opitutaceae bacterium LMO-M01]